MKHGISFVGSSLGSGLGRRSWPRTVRSSHSRAEIDKHIKKLRRISPSLLDSDHEGYLEDWTSRFRMRDGIVVRPKSTQEISEIISYCAKNQIPVIPQGGNSGLSGGSVGKSGSVILSMQSMNSVLEFDKANGIVSVEAGCILETLQQHVKDEGFIVPLDLGAKASCMIGGNLATAAGGLNVVRYGPIGRYVLGLEVVLGDGRIVDMDRKLFKDNMGLKLPQLFIGSEGILGVITKASIMLVPKPLHSAAALITLPSFSQIPTLLSAAKKELTEILSAFEFIDAKSMRALREDSPELMRGGLSSFHLQDAAAAGEATDGISGEVALLVEVSGSEEGVTDRLHAFVMRHVDMDSADKVLLPSNKSQERDLWTVREHVPVSLMQLSRQHGGRLYKYDLSLTMPQMQEVVSLLQRRIATEKEDKFPFLDVQVCNFGHCGDLNLHLNILARPLCSGEEQEQEQEKDVGRQLDALQVVLDEGVADEVIKRRGSLSAEHGVGQLKKRYMSRARSEEEISLMRAIKAVVDPQNIMNPSAMLPELEGA